MLHYGAHQLVILNLTVSAKPKKKKAKKVSRYTEKTEHIDDMVDELKQNHSSMYTSIVFGQRQLKQDVMIALLILQKGHSSRAKSQGRKPLTPKKNLSGISEQSNLTLRSTYIQQIKELHGLTEIEQ